MKGTKRNIIYLIILIIMIIFFIFSLKKLPVSNIENKQASYLILIQMIFLLLLVFAFLFVALKGLLYFIYETKENILGKKIRTKFFNIIFIIIIVISLPFSIYQVIFTNYLYKKWGSEFVRKAVFTNIEFSRYFLKKRSEELLKELKQNEKRYYKNLYHGKIDLENSQYIFKNNAIIVSFNNKLYAFPLSKEELNFIHISKKNYERYLYDIKFQKKATRYFLIISILIITVLLFVLAFWVAGFFGRNIIASIENLLKGTEEVKKNNYNFTIKKVSNDELGILTDRFNEMVQTIKKKQENLMRLNVELEYEKNFQKEIFSLLITPIIVLDEDCNIVFENRSFESLTIDENFLNEIKREIKEKDIKDILKVKKRIENRFYLINIIKFSKGYIALFEDFTDVLQMRLVEMWQQMARKLAHELKNPLTPISLSIDRIMKKYKEKSKDFDRIFEENTHIIKEEILRLSQLISHFNKFAKLPPPQMNEFNYRQFLIDIINLYKGNEKKISIHLVYHAKTENIVADQQQLKQVFINLFNNALDAIKESGNIEILVEENKKYIITYFSNDGEPIPKEHLSKIFDIYFSTKKSGTGLGLTMVKRIIDEHEGKIEVSSGEKTTFTIYLKKLL